MGWFDTARTPKGRKQNRGSCTQLPEQTRAGALRSATTICQGFVFAEEVAGGTPSLPSSPLQVASELQLFGKKHFFLWVSRKQNVALHCLLRIWNAARCLAAQLVPCSGTTAPQSHARRFGEGQPLPSLEVLSTPAGGPVPLHQPPIPNTNCSRGSHPAHQRRA